jgi:anti-sigma regulatory factor (Ser/Thr protein kinase)
MYTLRLPAKLESLETFRSFVLQTIKDWNITQTIVPKIELVLEEVLTNIINYAYPTGEGDVEVKCTLLNKDKLCFVIQDWGNPFNPLMKNSPDLSADLFERRIGGLGIFLVRTMVDELDYRHEEGTNILKLCMKIKR